MFNYSSIQQLCGLENLAVHVGTMLPRMSSTYCTVFSLILTGDAVGSTCHSGKDKERGVLGGGVRGFSGLCWISGQVPK